MVEHSAEPDGNADDDGGLDALVDGGGPEWRGALEMPLATIDFADLDPALLPPFAQADPTEPGRSAEPEGPAGS